MSRYANNLVSVIVPVYNVEPYLRRCVNSIRVQTHQNLEIILVNDGSTDDSPDICDELAKEDSRIIVVHQDNKGLGSARNSGLDTMHGEWLCFIDSDDYISPVFVETLLTVAIENDCLTVQCKYQEFYDYLTDKEQSETHVKVMDRRNYMFYVGNTSGHSAMSVCFNIYHSTLFDDVRFCTLRMSEDIPTVPKIIWGARKMNLAIIDKVLYFYYQRMQSQARGVRSFRWVDQVTAFEMAMDFWEKNNEHELYELYWDWYFFEIVSLYLSLMRDIPEQRREFAFIYDKIIENLDKAKERCHYVLTFHLGAESIWARITSPNSQIVIYGYNDICKKNLLPWAMYFQLHILEIWDQKANLVEAVEGIPFRKAHNSLDKNVIICISVWNRFTALQIQRTLSEMGYCNFIHYPTLNVAFTYAKYNHFLPVFLESRG